MNGSWADQQQSLVEHLVDLRKCIVRSLYFIFAGFLLCWNFSEKIFDIVRLPIEPYLGEKAGLVFTAPLDKFTAHLKVSFLAGIIFSCPFWLYQIWKFILPALYEKEKKGGLLFLFFGSLLFLVGVFFAYFLVFPATFSFLMNFGGSTDKPMITISEYLSFFITTTLAFGVCFELPMILVVLGRLGIISAQFLSEKRRYAIVLMGLIAAILTPPDVLSMLMMLVPMMALYEISILLVRSFEVKNKKNFRV